jgi:hypothetical protein
MTKELRFKRDGDFRKILQPYVHKGGEWKAAQKVFRKEAGQWVEWWPLRPLAPTNLAVAFPYQNDRIEAVVSWQAPASGPTISSYVVKFNVAALVFTRTTSATSLTDVRLPGWQQYAGQRAVVEVYGVTATGMVGSTVSSGQLVVPQLPAPPDPTAVALTLSNRSATLSWAHVGGNRLSKFETKTTYQSKTYDKDAAASARSLNVTGWSTTAAPGDPGGDIGVIVRAVGPGGASRWVSTTGALPGVPNPVNPVPPTAVRLPGEVTLTNHRFLNGSLRANYVSANTTTVRVWWQKEGSSVVLVGNQSGQSGVITIAASANWARDEVSRYRIVVQAVNANGDLGPVARGPWARKIPNPFYIAPVVTVSTRNEVVQLEGPVLVRQGASLNVQRWRGYALYGERTRDRINPSFVGYQLAISKSQVLLQRDTSGGSGSSVRPRLYFHPYKTLETLGTGMASPEDLAPLARGEWKWCDFNPDLARHLTSPDTNVNTARGVVVFHPNTTLLSSLGNVSAEYMRLLGSDYSADGRRLWTLKMWHDG